MLPTQHFDGPISMSDLDVPILEVELDLVVFEPIDLG
jgi:hypothetical protein